jgi:hypothetical protein
MIFDNGVNHIVEIVLNESNSGIELFSAGSSLDKGSELVIESLSRDCCGSTIGYSLGVIRSRNVFEQAHRNSESSGAS